MEYIRNDGNVTRIYDVVININKLLNVIRELDANCYHEVYKIEKIIAYSRDEAISIVNNTRNTAGLKINKLIDISDSYKDLVMDENSPYIFDCEMFSKESIELACILKKIIINYKYKDAFKNQNNYLIDALYEYKNCSELNDDNDKSSLLFELYNKAKECISFDLKSEIVHRKERMKVYTINELK